MILSHRHQFIFIPIPKTGTHAIREALRPHLGPDDWEQVLLHHTQTFPIPDIAAKKHGHIAAAEIRPHLIRAVWGRYFKFSFVRNPWDRFVAACAFGQKHEAQFKADPKAYMRAMLNDPQSMQHFFFRPQHEYVTDEKGALLTDFIGRQENLQQSFDKVCERIGLPHLELQRVNVSDREDYRGYFDEELKDKVGQVYVNDVALFGYEF